MNASLSVLGVKNVLNIPKPAESSGKMNQNSLVELWSRYRVSWASPAGAAEKRLHPCPCLSHSEILGNPVGLISVPCCVLGDR